MYSNILKACIETRHSYIYTAHTCIHHARMIILSHVTLKDVSKHNRDCNGKSSAHVQGRRQLDLVIRSILPLTYMYRDNVL